MIRSHIAHNSPSLSSVLTVRPSPDPNSIPTAVLPPSPDSTQSAIAEGTKLPVHHVHETTDVIGISSLMSIASIDTYHTIPRTVSSVISSTCATEGGSTIRSIYGNFVPPLVHRFTLLKPGAKRDGPSGPGDGGTAATASWNPLELFFSSGLLMVKCDLCGKRLGWKPVLECDDCGLRFVIICASAYTLIQSLFMTELILNVAKAHLAIAVSG